MFDYSHVKDLSNRNIMIATEAISLKPNISAISAKLKGVVGVMGEWVSERVKPQPSMAMINYGYSLRDINKITYSDVSTTPISMPRGLRSNMPVYVASLVPMVEFCETLERDVLRPFSIWVSIRKAAPLSLKDSTNITELKGYKQVNVDGFRQKINELIDPSARVDKVPMSRLYPSLGSLEDTWKASNSLITRYMNTKPKNIIKLTEEISKNILFIVNQLEEMGEAEKLAPASVAIMANLCYSMAAGVEFYGMVGQLLRELSVVCNNNNVELKKVIESAAKERSKLKMATESFVKPPKQGIEIGGIWYDYASLSEVAKESGSDLYGIEDVSWIFEYVDRDTIEDIEATNDGLIIAVSLGGTMYPLTGLPYLKAAEKAGLSSVNIARIAAEDLK